MAVRSHSGDTGRMGDTRVSRGPLWIYFGQGHGRNRIGKKLGETGILHALFDEMSTLEHDPILLLWREWTDTTQLAIMLTIDDAPAEHGLRPGLRVARRRPYLEADFVWTSEEAEAKLFAGTPAEVARALVAEVVARVDPRRAKVSNPDADPESSGQEPPVSTLDVRVPFQPGESWVGRLDELVEELADQVFGWRAGEVDDAEEEGDEISFVLIGPKPEPLMTAARNVLIHCGLLDQAYALWEDTNKEAMVRMEFRR